MDPTARGDDTNVIRAFSNHTRHIIGAPFDLSPCMALVCLLELGDIKIHESFVQEK